MIATIAVCSIGFLSTSAIAGQDEFQRQMTQHGAVDGIASHDDRHGLYVYGFWRYAQTLTGMLDIESEHIVTV